MLKSYETVLIFNPVLKEKEVQEVIGNYRELLKSYKADIVEEDFWGLRQLAYPIKKKTTGFYLVLEYKVDATAIDRLEIQFKRDENIMRFLTIRMEKYHLEYNERKRRGLAGRNRKKTEAEKTNEEGQQQS